MPVSLKSTLLTGDLARVRGRALAGEGMPVSLDMSELSTGGLTRVRGPSRRGGAQGGEGLRRLPGQHTLERSLIAHLEGEAPSRASRASTRIPNEEDGRARREGGSGRPGLDPGRAEAPTARRSANVCAVDTKRSNTQT